MFKKSNYEERKISRSTREGWLAMITTYFTISFFFFLFKSNSTIFKGRILSYFFEKTFLEPR